MSKDNPWTKEQVDALVKFHREHRQPKPPSDMTDAELNAAVAQEVMGNGYAVRTGQAIKQTGPHSATPWFPTTDIAAAFEVVERMRELGWEQVNVNVAEDDLAYCWMKRPGPTKVTNSQAPTPARAISEAALEAVRSEG